MPNGDYTLHSHSNAIFRYIYFIYLISKPISIRIQRILTHEQMLFVRTQYYKLKVLLCPLHGESNRNELKMKNWRNCPSFDANKRRTRPIRSSERKPIRISHPKPEMTKSSEIKINAWPTIEEHNDFLICHTIRYSRGVCETCGSAHGAMAIFSFRFCHNFAGLRVSAFFIFKFISIFLHKSAKKSSVVCLIDSDSSRFRSQFRSVIYFFWPIWNYTVLVTHIRHICRFDSGDPDNRVIRTHARIAREWMYSVCIVPVAREEIRMLLQLFYYYFFLSIVVEPVPVNCVAFLNGSAEIGSKKMELSMAARQENRKQIKTNIAALTA